MSDIKNWSNSAGGNTAASPNGFPEGMAPSGVNDSMRETMASVKRWYETAEWIDFGHTPTFVGTGSFLVSAGQAATATYHIGRRIRALDGSSTIYGTIHSSTWTASAVYIYTTNDAGANFTASLSGIAVGASSFVNRSIPDFTASYAISANSASAATRAQYADSAGYANAGWDGSAARSFGVTASANTIPVALATGKLSSDWIPGGAGGSWDMTGTISLSISVSGGGAAKLYAITSITLPNAGKYQLETWGSMTFRGPNYQPVTFKIGLGTATSTASGNYLAQTMVVSSATTGVTYTFDHRPFVYSASQTQTLVVYASSTAYMYINPLLCIKYE